MQDRYAGDLGDFLKLGLLRWLCAPVQGAPPLRLGIVWYRVPDEFHNADGKHVAYLNPDHMAATELRRLDPDLYERLARMVESGTRSVATLQAAGALPPGTCTFSDALHLDDLPASDRTARLAHRRDWLDRALEATEGCDIVFVDPDNGIRTSSHAIPPYRNGSAKHACLSELAAFASRGQTIVAYHHADRSATVAGQAQRRLEDLATELPARPLAAIRASRGTARLFLVAAAPAHADRLVARIDALRASEWSKELIVYWADGEPH